MRRLLPFIFVLLLFAEETNPFAIYQANPSFETFNEVHTTYMKSIEDGEDADGARLMLSWLHLSEIYRITEPLDANVDSLPAGLGFQYANLLLSLGQIDEAIAIYEVVTELSPDWSCPWRHKGEAYFKAKDYDNAEKAILMAIKTRVEHYDAYIWLARVQKAKGEYEKALASIETGFTYYGKDIEDPEEEAPMQEVVQLKLELLKLTQKDGEFKDLLKKSKKNFPENPVWDTL